MRIIGTAGHIDHGKSTLVLALTGIDPDRLPEEKARGMTIELGFAWLDLGDRTDSGAPDPVGVIDVPGHERFVRHMLAGVGGIDLALLVVAADETVMPQTREHLAILDLLDVRHGVVALTKADLVDEEWLELAREEVRAALADTSLDGSPIVACSGVTGAGLDELRGTLRDALAHTPLRGDRGRPHLPIDRVFTRDGFGTVVTGTLLDGSLRLGQEVALLPGDRRARIRGLQSHHSQFDRAGPGRRVAVNLAGVAVDEVARGMVLAPPGAVTETRHLDLRLRVVRAAPPAAQARAALAAEVTHNMPIVLHTGTAEASGRLRLLDADRIGPGGEGWAQVRLDAPIAVLRGDRCVLRIPSPAATVAGGTVVVVNPPRRRRFDAATMARLAMLAAATPEERVQDTLHAGPGTAAELAARADMQPAAVAASLAMLEASARARRLGAPRTSDAGAGYWAAPAWIEDAERRTVAALTAHQRAFPLRQGLQGEAARAALGLERRVWAALLETLELGGSVAVRGDLIATPEHRVAPTEAQERDAAALLAALDAAPYNPPPIAELGAIDQELVEWLAGRGAIERIAEGLWLSASGHATMRDWALATIDETGTVTVGALRDRFATSRKVALALLEHLDDLRLTRRLGDGRVRGTVRLREAPPRP